jgi:hypothetical protein
MNEEYHSLMGNDTWDTLPLLKGRKLIRCKWLYKSMLGMCYIICAWGDHRGGSKP